MSVNYSAVLGTLPFFLFQINDSGNIFFFDKFKVLNHAHSIMSPVTLVNQF